MASQKYEVNIKEEVSNPGWVLLYNSGVYVQESYSYVPPKY